MMSCINESNIVDINEKNENTFEKIIKNDPLGNVLWKNLFGEDDIFYENEIETEYYDIEVFSSYSLLILNKDDCEIIIGITDNLIDTDYLVKNNNIDFFYKIDYSEIEQNDEIKYNKFFSKDLNYKISTLKPEIEKSIYVIYNIIEFTISPIQIFKNYDLAIKFINDIDKAVFIAELKINKIYDSVYKYESFCLLQS